MRVVFLEDVQGVALGGDVKEVKNGFARNYLIPKKLAVPASHDILQRVERLKRQAGVTRLKELEDMKELAGELDGVRLDIEMRAGSSGRLYGSVTNAIVANSISEITGREIDRRTIAIPDSIRQIGVYEATVRLHSDVDAKVTLVIYAPGMEPDEIVQQAAELAETAVADATDEPAAEVAETADEATTEASDEPAAEVAEAEATDATDEPAAELAEAEATDESAEDGQSDGPDAEEPPAGSDGSQADAEDAESQ